MGTTPDKLELDYQEICLIEFRKDRYKSITKAVKVSVAVKQIVLDVLGRFIPVIVDAAKGNWHQFDKDRINSNLEKQ